MEEQVKDKEYELTVGASAINGSLKIKNSNNRVLAEIGNVVIDSLAYFRWNNAVKFLDKYNKKKEERKLAGKETPLPPKFILEILDNAFQEDNEEVQDEWNNLLINWQDLEKKCDKKFMYIEILKNLGINEIKLLKLISNDPNFEEARKNSQSYYDGENIKKILKLTDEEYELMILNLYRLKVCDSFKSSGNEIVFGDLSVFAEAGIKKFRLTVIGYKLLESLAE